MPRFGVGRRILKTFKTHAKLSASGSERWLSCPGSVILSDGLPDTESDAAKEGTLAHECLEFLLKNRAHPLSKLKRILDKKNCYPPEMLSYVLDSRNEILRHLMPEHIFLCETKIDLTFVGPGMFGTIDAAIIALGNTLKVFDFKYGKGKAVEVENNTQLIYYALGIAHQYAYKFKQVELVILQPRAKLRGQWIRGQKIPMDRFKTWIPKFKRGVEETLNPWADLNAGPWCWFCKAKWKCPITRDKQLENDFNDMSDF